MQFVGPGARAPGCGGLQPVADGRHRGMLSPEILGDDSEVLAEHFDSRVDESTCVAVKRGEEWTHVLRDERLVVKLRTGRAGRRRPVAREFNIHRTLVEQGVAVPEALGYLEPHQGTDCDLHYLLFRELPAELNAREVLRDARAARCRRMQAKLGRLIADLHEVGWTHGDLNLKNVLVAADDTLYLIDLDHAVRPWAGVRTFLEMRDLRDVWISLRRTPATSDFDLVLESYADRRGFSASRTRRWRRVVTLLPKKKELVGTKAEVLRPEPR